MRNTISITLQVTTNITVKVAEDANHYHCLYTVEQNPTGIAFFVVYKITVHSGTRAPVTRDVSTFLSKSIPNLPRLRVYWCQP